MASSNGEPSWKWRRIVVFTTLGGCWAYLGFLIVTNAPDTELNGTIASGLLWLLGATALGYLGFGTAQDAVAIVTARSGRPYAADSVPAPPTPAVPDTVVINAAPPPSDSGG